MASSRTTRTVSPGVAARLAYGGGLASVLLEALLAGLLAGLFVVLVGRVERGAEVWVLGVLCGLFAGASLFLERRPTRAACLARADRELGLAGALQLGVELEAGLSTAPRYIAAVEAALEGRLGRSAVLRAAWAVRPLAVVLAMLGIAGLLGALGAQQGADQGGNIRGVGGATNVAENQIENRLATTPEGARTEVEELATEAPETSGNAPGASPENPEEALREAEPPTATDASGASAASKDEVETAKLPSGGPSGVTPEPDGGKMDPRSTLPPAGSWWPARHDAVVRAWLRSWNRPAGPDGPR